MPHPSRCVQDFAGALGELRHLLMELAGPPAPQPSRMHMRLGPMCWIHEAGWTGTLLQRARQLDAGRVWRAQVAVTYAQHHTCPALRMSLGARQGPHMWLWTIGLASKSQHHPIPPAPHDMPVSPCPRFPVLLKRCMVFDLLVRNLLSCCLRCSKAS